MWLENGQNWILNDFAKPQMRNECRHEIPNSFDIFSHVEFLLMLLKCHLLQKMAKMYKLFDCRYICRIRNYLLPKINR